VSRRAGLNLRAERLAAGLRPDQLSAMITLSGSRVSAKLIELIEHGIPDRRRGRRVRVMSVDEAWIFAGVLGIPVTRLLEERSDDGQDS
jgi:hypothetical protein